jgi:GT2 family glycosyltransferase
VVVHHRSPDTLPRTVASLLAAGLDPRKVVVVDNSEDESLASTVLGDLRILVTANDGYGSAVNAGVAWLAREHPGLAAILVSTHEVVVEPDTVTELLDGLALPGTAAVGPVLWEARSADGAIWSAGGVLAGRGLVARHRHAPRDDSRFAEADWLDGALVLYRSQLLEAYGFDTTYFLYLEEVDLHLRLRRAGWQIRVAHQARASQATAGMPAYWAMRNRVYFGRKFSLGAAGWLGTTWVLLQVVRRAVRTRDPSLLSGIHRGLLSGARLTAPDHAGSATPPRAGS